MYVIIDSAWHLMGEDETTECGIVVPYGTDWVRDREVPEGEDIHCGPDATKAEKNQPAAKSKAKAKKG